MLAMKTYVFSDYLFPMWEFSDLPIKVSPFLLQCCRRFEIWLAIAGKGKEAVMGGARRTPIGNFGGSLKRVPLMIWVRSFLTVC